ncbi:MAG: nuclease-related domain-containing protein [Archangium sp.]
MHLEADSIPAARARFSSESWKIAGLAEASVAESLRRLDHRKWTLRHDVAIAPGHHVDHVVAGPSGVFVIDSRIHVGDVRVDRDGVRIDGHDTALVATALESARVVHGLLQRCAWVTPVLVFGRGVEIDDEPERVMVVTTDELNDFLEKHPWRVQPHVVEKVSRLIADDGTWYR